VAIGEGGSYVQRRGVSGLGIFSRGLRERGDRWKEKLKKCTPEQRNSGVSSKGEGGVKNPKSKSDKRKGGLGKGGGKEARRRSPGGVFSLEATDFHQNCDHREREKPCKGSGKQLKIQSTEGVLVFSPVGKREKKKKNLQKASSRPCGPVSE